MKTSVAGITGLLATATLAGLTALAAPATAAVTVNAGDQINTGGMKCTLGFIVKDTNGKDFGLTAGHCGAVGEAVKVGGQEVGKFVESESPDSLILSISVQDGTGDWGLIEFNDGVATNPSGNFGAGRKPIAAYQVDSAPTVGQEVCTTGSTTGYSCGKIISINKSDSRVTTNITRFPGDSGGPLYDAHNGKAIGVLSTLGAGLDGLHTTYFSVSKAITTSPTLNGNPGAGHNVGGGAGSLGGSLGDVIGS